MPQRYYQLDVFKQEARAEIVIFGDITSWPWLESDVSSWGLAKQLAELGDDIDEITVHINSYGGEVAEGIAIFNALKAHKAHVTTVCDGMACSIASVIFMAGDQRVMNEASLLMIHNAWTRASGDASDLRKQADDLDTITGMSKSAYLAYVDLDEEELAAWMDAETWITPDMAIEHGFATRVEPIVETDASQQGAASARMALMSLVLNAGAETVSVDPEAVIRLLVEKYADEPAPEPASEAAEEAADAPDAGQEQEPSGLDTRLRMARAAMALSKSL